MKYTIVASQMTDQGKVRRNNQDSMGHVTAGEKSLYILADGLGGMKHGEVASREAVLEIRSLFEAEPSADSKPWLEKAFQKVNTKIYNFNKPLRRSEWMATTLTVSKFDGDRVIIGHVGDCRVYQYRAGRMNCLTTDHAMDRNVLTRAIGIDAEVQADIYEASIEIGDVFVQCSDGLYSMAYDYQIAETVKDFSPRISCERLIALANQHGGVDNVSVQVISICKT